MIHQRLAYLKELGIYNELVTAGVIPIKVNYFYEIYVYHDKMLILNGNKKMQSLTDTADAFKCSESTVKRALNLMK